MNYLKRSLINLHGQFNTFFIQNIRAYSSQKIILLVFSFASLLSCSKSSSSNQGTEEPVASIPKFYFGADLSYVNELEDCGAIYKNRNGIVQDPFTIFSDAGANLVRVRLWHDPDWTNYSDYNDVKKTILRAKQSGMHVLLDFHYSDTWADPGKQEIPAAWLEYIDDTEALGKLLYDYTYEILNNLDKEELLPEMVQVGNEVNAMILQHGELKWPIDWERNSFLLNKGIQAIRDISKEKNKDVEVMLHIAQPENALWWFEQAINNNVTDFDWIGISYYPAWSEYTLTEIPDAIETLITTYKKQLMVVETAYPFTMENKDTANNILDNNALIEGYSPTQQGQYNYLKDLHQVIKEAGGGGLVYWEPAWISTDCGTLWAEKGSHWDNATLFDHKNTATLGMEFYNLSLSKTN